MDQVDVSELVTDSTILLLVATAVALLARRLRIPYVTGLVVAGLMLAEFLPGHGTLDSALILDLFLPILLFESAIKIDISELRSSIAPIALLAGPGVAICSAIAGVSLKFALNLDWIPALLLGTMLATTDTVSVIALFKEVSVPSRLTTIVEGESLFNDGVALVLFTLILKIHAKGIASVSWQDGIELIFLEIGGGCLLGLAIGYLSAALFVRLNDNLSGILLTVAVALGTYEIGHRVGVSGVVAVVVAGVIVGNVGLASNSEVPASERVTLYSFWEYAGFGVNTFIFLLIGLEVDLFQVWQALPSVLLAILAYQIGRIFSVYPLVALVNCFDAPIPFSWQNVLFLGNIKGSISMALALSLPATLTGRGEVVTLVFGSVLLSVVVQGLSLPWLVKHLNLSPPSPFQSQIEPLIADLIIAKTAQDTLKDMLTAGMLPKAFYEAMRLAYDAQENKAEEALCDLYNQWNNQVANGEGDASLLDGFRRYLLLSEKEALSNALRKGVLSEAVVKERLGEIDEKLLNLADD